MSELKTAVEVAQALERGEVVVRTLRRSGFADPDPIEYRRWVWEPDCWKYHIKREPREWWAVDFSGGLPILVSSFDVATEWAGRNPSERKAIKVREVTE